MFGCYYKNELENGMPNMTLENIAKACEGTYVGESADLQIGRASCRERV